MTAGTATERVNEIARAAAEAAPSFAATSAAVRADLLERIASGLQHDADRLVEAAVAETRLTVPRLRGEVDRTAYQLGAFADEIRTGRHLRPVVERPDPGYPLGGPSPDLRASAYPVGAVAVFAASNFPFAFSVAGGDTASALAAGCPVVVKAHPGHPALSREVAALVREALTACALDEGVFGLVEGEEAGVTLLQHPGIRAAAFTGSTRGGRALFDIAVGRPDPIPFYGELGSVNPVYVTREALERDSEAIAAGFVASYTLGAGQFCTKPGLVFVPRGGGFAERVAELVDDVQPQAMLNDRIRTGYDALETAFEMEGVQAVRVGRSTTEGIAPSVYRTPLETFLRDSDTLAQERFGPSALIVEYDDVADLRSAVRAVEGTLTSTVHAAGPGDAGLRDLVDEARRHSGRLIYNGWPTGVTVSPAMMHGRPYPASTSAAHTSVGLRAIERFLRPVSYQGFPDELLPAELVDPV